MAALKTAPSSSFGAGTTSRPPLAATQRSRSHAIDAAVAANLDTDAGKQLVGVRRVPSLLMPLRIDAVGGLGNWRPCRTTRCRRLDQNAAAAALPPGVPRLGRAGPPRAPATRVQGHRRARGTRIDVDVTEAAAARFSRLDVGRGILRRGLIEIAGPYSERRLRPRRMPEVDASARVDGSAHAGGSAGDPRPCRRDGRSASHAARSSRVAAFRDRPPTAEGAARRDTASPGRAPRRSPVAHWRHYTAGAVFDNPARPRINVPGIGWCVRIRVNPRGGTAARDQAT